MSSAPEMTRRPRLTVGCASLCFAALALAAAEPLPPAEILQQLRAFATTGTVLHVGAHPDDENTELITYFSRGRGYRTAYLSLTRGDGGQNELGPDFDEKLGVLRTQELLAARKIDGGRQFFTRAIDFGYSKTPEETLKFWNREQVLGDVVRIYRQFRPDVVITRFPIPPGSGGHGHHTASGILAVEAFKLAGDPNAYPEQIAEGLAPWQPRRIFWNTFRFGPNTGPLPLDGPVTKLDIAGVDAATGEEFGKIAARSRAMHATQGLAGFINRARTGPNEQNFLLMGGDPVTTDLFDGIDTTWSRIPGGVEIQKLADEAIAKFDLQNPSASVPAFLSLRGKLVALGAHTADEVVSTPAEDRVPLTLFLEEKLAHLDRVIRAALGLIAQATAKPPEVLERESFAVDYSLQIGAATVPVDWSVISTSVLTGRRLEPGVATTQRLEREQLPAYETTVTHPYWLRQDPVGGLAAVPARDFRGLPENPPPATHFSISIAGGAPIPFEAPIEYPNPVSGRREPLRVVSPVAITPVAGVTLLPVSGHSSIDLEVVAARLSQSGSLRLEVPAGWSVSPASQPFSLANAGDKAKFTFTVTAPAKPSVGFMQAFAEVGGRRYSHQRIELRYAHLPPQLLQPPARARLLAADVAIKGRTVGYLPGAGDSAAEALQQMGYTVRPLTGADLTPEKLAGLDAVVIGVRAFNERTDLKDNLAGLLAWVEQGGTVVAQYNRPNGLITERLGPYPLSLAGQAPAQRITDETAPFTFLAPGHPVLNTPNKITPADFDGWVQERGAYFPSKWDAAYTPILAGSDPGEAPLHGALLVAKHGKGCYVYTSLAFFRQLPAGVPGAWRLFANLVSLRGE
jgi:LmbE family N-acetylglucosaminyl deacetylase